MLIKLRCAVRVFAVFWDTQRSRQLFSNTCPMIQFKTEWQRKKRWHTFGVREDPEESSTFFSDMHKHHIGIMGCSAEMRHWLNHVMWDVNRNMKGIRSMRLTSGILSYLVCGQQSEYSCAWKCTRKSVHKPVFKTFNPHVYHGTKKIYQM